MKTLNVSISDDDFVKYGFKQANLSLDEFVEKIENYSPAKKMDETEYVLNNQTLMQQIALSEKTHLQRSGYQPTAEELNEIISI